MDYTILVQVADAQADVYENLPNNILIKCFPNMVLFLYKSVKIPIRAKLQYDIDFLIFYKTVIIADHVWRV